MAMSDGESDDVRLLADEAGSGAEARRGLLGERAPDGAGAARRGLLRPAAAGAAAVLVLVAGYGLVDMLGRPDASASPGGFATAATKESVELWSGGDGCSWIGQDNCKNQDQFACHCRAMNPDGPCTPCPASHQRGELVQPEKPAWAQRPISSTSGARSRKGSFLVIGDWGYDFACHGNVPDLGCQQLIAQTMLKKFNELGDVKFIINVGDSFYPHGVFGKDDPQWQTKWRDVFDPKLRSVPWYSVYGNHDLQHDPCMCSDRLEDCAQINADVSNMSYFFMPDVNWFKGHPELDLEVIGLDLNHYMLGWDQSKPSSRQEFEDCQYTACESSCRGRAQRRGKEAFDLFRARVSESSAKNLIVFSHYPTDYFSSERWFLDELSNAAKHKILYLGGHRHSTDQTSTTSIAPNENWLVGGGGGWSCDGPDQGFVVGEIATDSTISTYPVIVDHDTCCQAPGPSPWKGDACAWLGCDNCIDPKMCECRAMNPDGPCTSCPNPQSKGRICSGTSCSDGHIQNSTRSR